MKGWETKVVSYIVSQELSCPVWTTGEPGELVASSSECRAPRMYNTELGVFVKSFTFWKRKKLRAKPRAQLCFNMQRMSRWVYQIRLPHYMCFWEFCKWSCAVVLTWDATHILISCLWKIMRFQHGWLKVCLTLSHRGGRLVLMQQDVFDTAVSLGKQCMEVPFWV